MVDASGIASKYKYLFKPPGANVSPLILLTTALLTAIVIEQTDFVLTELLAWLFSLAIAPLMMNVVTSKTVFKGSKVVNLRRLNMLSLLANYFSLAASLIGFLYLVTTSGQQVSWRAYFASVSLAGNVRVTVLSIYEGPLKGYSVGVSEVLLRYLVALMRSELYHPATISLAVTLSVPIGSIVLLSKRFSGTTSMRLAKGFATVILSGDSNLLERELRFLATRRDFSSTALAFETSSGKRLVLLVTDFHFGPFRNVGSSMMNYQAELEFSRRGMEALVVKGCAGHDADIVDSSSVSRVLKELADGVAECNGPSSGSLSVLPQRLIDGISMIGFEACGRSFVAVTLHPKPMEDFPKALEDPFRSLGVRLIDPHNSFEDGYKGLAEPELERVQRALESYLKSDRISGKPRVALVREVPEDLSPTEGLGPSGMAVLGLEAGGVRVALAVVDGNNALPEVRPAVIEAVKEAGWDQVEFLTTDTHAVNGVRLGGRGYKTVGEVMGSKALAERLGRLAKRALNSLEPAEVRVLDITHTDVPTLSEEALERFSVLMQRSIVAYLALLVASGSIPLLL